MPTTQEIDRLPLARELRIATALVLALLCFATVRGLGQQQTTPASKSRVLIQNRSSNKNSSDPTKPDPTKPDPTKPDPTKPDPTLTQTPQTQPRKEPRLQLTAAPPQVRVDEEVTFNVKPVERVRLVRATPLLTINFGDGSPEERIRINSAGVLHRFARAGSYDVSVYLGDSRRRRVQSTPVSNTVTVQVTQSGTNSPSVGGPGGVGPQSPFLVYILVGLIVIGIALVGAVYKMWKGQSSVRPDFVAMADRGLAQAGDGRLPLDFELHFTPNSREAKYQIDAPGAGLIRFERITRE